ncbi:hypothetical protein AAFF_G00198030 [Aldrovandia affinis]|uniref:Uncharacterized protein n=1 Tax=Aldrovandia affinis TaxID=143900 RepID=A0AAD7RL86_9TELE|nr:hypothetical protein AAFF_G00198030 [Aldrovandia affinis]
MVRSSPTHCTWEANVEFLCSDVACRYFPCLNDVSKDCPELQDLLNTKAFLSVWHAKAHTYKYDGCKGLQCLVQRQLAELRSFQHGMKQKYLSILTSADFSQPDNEEELHDSSEAEINSDEEE